MTNNYNLLFKNFLKVLIIISIISIFLVPQFYETLELYAIGRVFANLAAVVFLLTAIPGIIRRLNTNQNPILKKIQILLNTSRAQLGILMFFLASNHYAFSKIIPVIQSGVPATLVPFEIAGFAAFFSSLLLAITSNKQSQRILKKKWKKLHMLAYLILWLIFVHIAFVGDLWLQALFLIIGLIQVFSLIKVKFLKKN